MNWTLESFKLFLGYRSQQEPVDTVAKVFGVLPKYGTRFVPTEALAVDDDPFQVRTMSVDLADPEAVIRLGRTKEDHKLVGFSVTLYNETTMNLDWSMGHSPGYLIDAFQLSIHRDYVQSEEDVQALLSLASDLQPILMPIVGHISDYKVESANPVTFEYRRNSHELPDRIRWANFWGPAMVDRLGGIKKVMAAPAYEVRAFANGGVLLLSTSTLLTYGEAKDATRRQAIWEWFNLENLHEQLSRVKEKERLEKRRAKEMTSRRDN
jgi:hypothetical protein